MGALTQMIGPMLAEGRLLAAVEECKQAVRRDPSSIAARVALYELSVFLGDWGRCRGQVETIVSLGGDPLHWMGHMADIHAATCRDDCWRGLRRPPVVGACDTEEQAMFDGLWQAVAGLAGGDIAPLEAHAAEFGGMAFGPGKLNGAPFAALSTLDSRLPGVLEISDGGEYGWLWLGAVSRIELRGGATNLTEVVWLPGRVVFTSGEIKAVAVFGLYPGTADATDPLVALGRRTVWDDGPEALALGAGGQLLEIDGQPVPLQQIRLLEFAEADSPTEASPPAQ